MSITACHSGRAVAQKFLTKPQIPGLPKKIGAKSVPHGMDAVIIPYSGSVQTSLKNLPDPANG
jgi:hypothetical protein